MRQYYKRAAKILKKAAFREGNADTCLYMRKGANGILYIALYVDENLMVGNPEAIDALQKYRLVLKVVEGLQDCKVKFTVDKKISSTSLKVP